MDTHQLDLARTVKQLQELLLEDLRRNECAAAYDTELEILAQLNRLIRTKLEHEAKSDRAEVKAVIQAALDRDLVPHMLKMSDEQAAQMFQAMPPEVQAGFRDIAKSFGLPDEAMGKVFGALPNPPPDWVAEEIAKLEAEEKETPKPE